MHYLLAPDSFKESADAISVADAMRRGILSVDTNAQITMLPLSDGGEGLTTALVHATHGETRTAIVHDALGREIEASYGFLGGTEQRSAVIEMASASGIERIAPEERNPLRSSSRGTGELMLAAIHDGAQRIILGLGGSASNDGGAGIASAFGYRFLDHHGDVLGDGGASLALLDSIDSRYVDRHASSVPIILASDVTNPLTGSNGASYVFGPQKGADASEVEQLDNALDHFADCIETLNSKLVRNIPGAGAAGGAGAGLLALFNTTIVSGIGLVLDLVHGKHACEQADIVITGEGRIDGQTPYGKVPSGIATLAQSCGTPTIAIGGSVSLTAHSRKALHDIGVVATFSIAPGAANLNTLMANTSANIESTCASIAGLVASLCDNCHQPSHSHSVHETRD